MNLLGKRYLFFTLSALVILPGLILLATTGLPLSIDFTGGSLLEVTFDGELPSTEDVLAVYEEANIKDATITRFNFQNNDLQDFSPSNIFTGTGWGTTATYSAVGNQVGTDARALDVTLTNGTTSTVISNSNLMGRSTGPIFNATEAVFNTINARITNYAFGSVTLEYTNPGSTITVAMSVI